MAKIAVIGDGGWGTAVALLLAGNKHDVTIWSPFPEYAKILEKKRENVKFLPGLKLPRSIKIETDISQALAGKNLVVSAIPTQFLRKVWHSAKPFIDRSVPIVSLSKGIEIKTLLRPSEIIKSELGGVPVVVLSGPSHAEEVAHKLPAVVVAASKNKQFSTMVQKAFMNSAFRVYTHDDIIGVELGGALKNVIAIASGIIDGLKLGDNSKAALITRGVAEITRLGMTMGAKKETFGGLSGIGDLVTTCYSPHGRNLAVGKKLGQGKSLKSILESNATVAEGVPTAKAVYSLQKTHGIETPICKEVYLILFRNKPPKKALQELMTRPPKQE